MKSQLGNKSWGIMLIPIASAVDLDNIFHLLTTLHSISLGFFFQFHFDCFEPSFLFFYLLADQLECNFFCFQ